ncbi:hypothetical protein BU23DRAFT_297766 [Bimuria novae-zelandiae CBS 107.79]|uniref:Uncharacterized protein n=1 Tax=Bimuria novae-zelandiae CBS 107.79 TaxID=1447943 RepID=A0A6A5VIM5_9PLEO|nr:hypothetical protein BU23DRAFT_297766 [Bimuria novae-zelandiae CBS 107.79]
MTALLTYRRFSQRSKVRRSLFVFVAWAALRRAFLLGSAWSTEVSVSSLPPPAGCGSPPEDIAGCATGIFCFVFLRAPPFFTATDRWLLPIEGAEVSSSSSSAQSMTLLRNRPVRRRSTTGRSSSSSLCDIGRLRFWTCVRPSCSRSISSASLRSDSTPS